MPSEIIEIFSGIDVEMVKRLKALKVKLMKDFEEL